MRTEEQIQRAVVKQQGRKPTGKCTGSNKIWLRQVLRCNLTCTWPIRNSTGVYLVAQLQLVLERTFGRLLITTALCSTAFLRCHDRSQAAIRMEPRSNLRWLDKRHGFAQPCKVATSRVVRFKHSAGLLCNKFADHGHNAALIAARPNRNG